MTWWCSTNDVDRLHHIRDHGQLALEIVAGHDLEKNDVARLALERALYILGEAANYLSPDIRASIHQPWRQIIGLRILLAHQYEAVQAPRLHKIVNDHVPSLLEAVDSYLKKCLD